MPPKKQNLKKVSALFVCTLAFFEIKLIVKMEQLL